MTKKELATKLGISTRTLQRRMLSLNLTELTDEAINTLSQSQQPETLPTLTPIEIPGPIEVDIKEEKIKGYSEEFLNRKKEKKQQPVLSSTPVEPSPIFTKSNNIAAAVTLILTDATCCAWIAVNSFSGTYTYFATAIFFFAGTAIGYSAIKNTAEYTGKDSNAWLWGFAIFQVLLHSCALEVIGQYSFPLGKIVMSVGGAMATAGLALTFKK